MHRGVVAKKILLVFAFLLSFSLVSFMVYALDIDFVSPTAADSAKISSNFTEINVSIEGIDLDSLNYTWDGTNYTFYDDSLVLMMNFNNNPTIWENSSYAVDVSKFGNNGTFYGSGGANNLPQWNTSGKFGSALSFDGTDDYVECRNDPSLNPTNQVTIALWARPANAISGYDNLVCNWDGSQNNWAFYFETGTAALRFYSNDIGGAFDSLKTSWNVGQWYFLAVTYNGSAVSHYVDGALDRTPQSASGTFSGTALPLCIGCWNENLGTNVFDGTMDEVRVWNRSLSIEELDQAYMSNLYKYNQSQWYLYVNQTSLTDGTHTYQTFSCNISGSCNSTDNRSITVDTTGPQFSTHERSPETPNEQDDVLLNITVTDVLSNVSSVWIQWNGTTNFTSEVKNVSTEFYVNITYTNYSARDYVQYSWWANDSLGNINSTGNYSFTASPVVPVIRNISISLVLNNTENMVYVAPAGSATNASQLGSGTSYSTPIKAYIASYSVSNVLAGLVGLGARYLNVSNATGTHTLKINQNLSNSYVMLAFTKGDWKIIDNRISTINNGDFMQEIAPSFAYGLGLRYAIKMVINCTGIDIQNNLILNPGQHNLVIDYNETDSTTNRPIMSIKTI